MLKKKMKRAKIDSATTEEVFESLTKSLPDEKIHGWQKQEDEALSNRGDSLDIYEVQMQKGIDTKYSPCSLC